MKVWVLLLLGVWAEESFDKKGVSCLLKIVLKRMDTQSVPVQDEYFRNLMAFAEGDFSRALLFDYSLVKSINTLTSGFESINDFALKAEILDCINDSLANTKARCEDLYGACEKFHATSFIKSCDAGEQQHNLKCYRSCAFYGMQDDDAGNLYSCKKPHVLELVVYPSMEECVSGGSEKQRQCDSYMDSFFTEECPPGFEKKFIYLCIPVCPEGMKDNNDTCYKQPTKRLPSPMNFVFEDFFLLEESKKTESKESPQAARAEISREGAKQAGDAGKKPQKLGADQ